MPDQYLVQNLQVVESGGYRPEWWTTKDTWLAATVISLMLETGFAKSKNEARRLIEQGGVHVDGERVTDAKAFVAVKPPAKVLVQVGKRRFKRIVWK